MGPDKPPHNATEQRGRSAADPTVQPVPCASPNRNPVAASELNKKLDSGTRRPAGTRRSTSLRLEGGGRRGPEGEAPPGSSTHFLPGLPQPYCTGVLASPHFTGGELRPRDGKNFSEFCSYQGRGRDEQTSPVPPVQGPSAATRPGPSLATLPPSCRAHQGLPGPSEELPSGQPGVC